MPIVRSADMAGVDYSKWTREDLVRLRGQLDAEPESADEARLLAAEIERRGVIQPVEQAKPFAPPAGVPAALQSPAAPTATPPRPSFATAPATRGIQGIQWWVLGSAVLMVIGAFGPWVKALGLSAGGTDGSNDGWLVVAAAVISALLFYATRTHRAAGISGLLGGVAGIAVTLYDRARVQNAIDEGGALAQAVAQVGWGLNLALAASVSLTVASAVHVFRQREQAEPLAQPTSTSSLAITLPSTPAPPPSSAPSPPPG
jgi:hypothetical protein